MTGPAPDPEVPDLEAPDLEGMRDRVNGWLEAINPVTRRLVAERTAYDSQLIPVTQYVTCLLYTSPSPRD